MFKSLQKDNVCKRQKPRVKRYKATHWVVLHCGSTIIRGVARKIPEVNKKSQIFHHPGCIAIYLPLPLLNVTEIQFWKKIRTKTCKRQKNLPKQCTVIPFTNKHWVSLYNVLEMIRSYPIRGWKQYLTHSPASGYVSLRSFVHSWRLSQIWKQRSHLYCTYSKMTTVIEAVCGRWAQFNKSFYLLQSIYDSYTIITQYIKQQVSIWIRFYTKQDVLL